MSKGLLVDESRMRRNLDLTQGLIVAEAVMMGLAPHLGRQNAHDIVYEACREALGQGPFPVRGAEVEPGRFQCVIGTIRLRALCDPANYLGRRRAWQTRLCGPSRPA